MGMDMGIDNTKPAPLFEQEGGGQKGWPQAAAQGNTGFGIGMGREDVKAPTL